MSFLAVWLGGLVGGMLRAAVEWTMPGDNGFPFVTLLINISGSCILGFFYGAAGPWKVKPWLRAGFGIGVIGSFTTFSTFCMDVSGRASVNLASTAVYVLASLVGGPVFAFAGERIAVILTNQSVKPTEELSV